MKREFPSKQIKANFSQMIGGGFVIFPSEFQNILVHKLRTDWDWWRGGEGHVVMFDQRNDKIRELIFSAVRSVWSDAKMWWVKIVQIINIIASSWLKYHNLSLELLFSATSTRPPPTRTPGSGEQQSLRMFQNHEMSLWRDTRSSGLVSWLDLRDQWLSGECLVIVSLWYLDLGDTNNITCFIFNIVRHQTKNIFHFLEEKVSLKCIFLFLRCCVVNLNFGFKSLWHNFRDWSSLKISPTLLSSSKYWWQNGNQINSTFVLNNW